MCEVTGGRQYSADLEQGGLEVPCKLSFICNDEERLATIKKNAWSSFEENNDYEMPLKKIKLESVEELEVPKEIPVAEPNENNADPEVQGCSITWIVVHLQKCRSVKLIESELRPIVCVY